MLQTVRVKNVDEKNGVICQVFMFPSWVTVLKFSNKVNFLQFSVKAIYICTSENFHCTLSEHDMVYRGLGHRSLDISD